MNLKSLTQTELAELFKNMGQPAFRAGQVYGWLQKGIESYDEMTNVPRNLRTLLEEQYPLCPPKVVRRQESKKDGTIKYLWQHQVPLAAVRRQLRGNRPHALSLRQHRVHLHRGGLPDGLRLLCLHPGRPGAEAGAL